VEVMPEMSIERVLVLLLLVAIVIFVVERLL
jgi:hypothetical protein